MRQRSTGFQAGLLAAILAATLQFVLWTVAVGGTFGPARADIVLAQAGQCDTDYGNAGTAHHHPGGGSCLLCPVCLAMSLPGMLPVPAVAAPLPLRLASIAMRFMAPAALLPVLRLQAAFPRGPPLV
jgi:hypothetical protein